MKREVSKTFNPKNFMWGSIVAIVAIMVMYSMYTDNPLTEVEIGDKVRIRLSGTVPGNTKYYKPHREAEDASPQSKQTFAFIVPGEEPLPIDRVDSVILEAGTDDAQNRHLPLVVKALEAGALENRYDERDILGTFSVWLTVRHSERKHLCYSYVTRLTGDDGSTTVGIRRACKTGDEWTSEILPALLELAGADAGKGQSPLVEAPEIRSIGDIKTCLTLRQKDLNRGLIRAKELINLCFAKGKIKDVEFEQARHGSITLAQRLNLTSQAAEVLHQFGYDLIQRGEYIGSRTFFEAMVLLNHYDPYAHNMIGASNIRLKHHEDALKNFNAAIEADPQYVHALLNRARTLIDLGRNREALKDLKAVIEYDKEPGRPSAEIARSLLKHI